MTFPNIFELNDGSKVRVDKMVAAQRVNYEFNIVLPDGTSDSFHFQIPSSDAERQEVLTTYSRNEAVAKLETKLNGLVIL
jgi:hypothetical protein